MQSALAHDLGQKVVHHNPLIMPAYYALNVFKGGRLILQTIRDRVVELEKDALQLRHNDVLVVAFVSNDCSPVDARQILCLSGLASGLAVAS